LKDGGTLVYSTCSLSKHQNEDIVNGLLSDHPDDVDLIPLHFPQLTGQDEGGGRERHMEDATTGNNTNRCVVVTPEGMVRFYPNLDTSRSSSRTMACEVQHSSQSVSHPPLLGDGFFVAKLRKRQRTLKKECNEVL
jgi:16S rRNA C967 or C1407 C5-methylase (RsmB/RsmF family)